MNSKNTGVWFVIAAGLFACIFLLDRFLRPPPVSTQNVLPNLQPAAVTSIQVIPAGAFEIRADRTNDSWLLAKPMAYPAQTAAIETLLSALQKLTPATRISAGELREHGTTSADFGFDAPQSTLVVEAGGDQRWQLLVGNKTAPGDQVFLRVVGVDGAFVADADWLKFIPHSASDWRSTALVAADESICDSIVLTNGAKIIELRRDATNRLWRMTRPLQARADSDRITYALQQLQTAQVAQFVTDEAKADLSVFGLQPADLDLWLNRGTNFISAIHTGKSPTNDAAQIYAKREGWSAVFTTAREPLSPWHGTVNDFRDPHLLELAAPVAEIAVQGPHNFTVQRQGTNAWKIVGEKFSADADNVQQFLKDLAGLRVAEFVEGRGDRAGFARLRAGDAARQITLRSAAGDTNTVIAQLSFAVQTNGIFVRRADEDFIYSITPEDFNRLPESGWELRDRRIWNFSETNVAQITLRQGGKTRALVHNGVNKWSLAAGSQGIINPPALEETTHRLGELTALGWVARNVTDPEKNFGLNPIIWKSSSNSKMGRRFPRHSAWSFRPSTTALAAVTLDGERWAFVFPTRLYQFVLTISPFRRTSRDMRPGSGATAVCVSAGAASARGCCCSPLLLGRVVQPRRPPGFSEDAAGCHAARTRNRTGIFRLRLGFERGIVAENVRIGGAQTATSPGLTLAEVRLQSGLPRVVAAAIAGGRARFASGQTPLAGLADECLAARQHPDRPAVSNQRHLVPRLFSGELCGREADVSGDIAHASEIHRRAIFQGSSTSSFPGWQARLRKISGTLDQIHVQGTPLLNLTVSGDARAIHSFVFRLKVTRAAVQTPWFRACAMRLAVNLTVPPGRR